MLNNRLQIEIKPLNQNHDWGAFCCGEQFIDNYLKKKAFKEHGQCKVRVYTASEPDSKIVLGFYTLSLISLAPKAIAPEEATVKFGTWAIPLVYLGIIGVTQEYQNGRGIGSALMFHAFQRTIEIANIAGTYGLSLDAINEDKATWYEKLDFKRFDVEKDGRVKMICSLNTIREALAYA